MEVFLADAGALEAHSDEQEKRQLIKARHYSFRIPASGSWNIEKMITLEHGVKPGLDKLHDLSLGEAAILGRHFFLYGLQDRNGQRHASSIALSVLPEGKGTTSGSSWRPMPR